MASGKRAENNLLKLFYKTGDNSEPKVGISVSAKVFKKAVERNRARRLASFGFEKLYTALLPNVNIIVLPKQEIIKLKALEVLPVLEKLLKTCNLIYDEKTGHSAD